MAFRRRFRRPFRRTFRRRTPLAHVRRTWVTALLPTVCDFTEFALVPCGELSNSSAQTRFILLTNSVLEAQFSDRARVVRIVGDLVFQPTWDGTVAGDCTGDFLAALTAYGQAHMGLRRYEKNAAGFALTVDPLGNTQDYSEAQWLRTWQHFWIPNAEVNFAASHTTKSCAVAICPDVHTTGAPDNIFTEGTGTIDIETDCSVYGPVECSATQDATCIESVKFPVPWHFKIDMKKRIPLREDQELALELEVMWPNTNTLVNPRVQVFGGIKLLLEY